MVQRFLQLNTILFCVWSRMWRWMSMVWTRQLRPAQGLVEYALILVLIAVVVVGVLTTLGVQTRSAFEEVECAMRGGEYHRDRGNGNSNRCR